VEQESHEMLDVIYLSHSVWVCKPDFSTGCGCIFMKFGDRIRLCTRKICKILGFVPEEMEDLYSGFWLQYYSGKEKISERYWHRLVWLVELSRNMKIRITDKWPWSPAKRLNLLCWRNVVNCAETAGRSRCLKTKPTFASVALYYEVPQDPPNKGISPL